LAETLPPQFTPRSKYYATKTIQFWEEIHKWGIKLLMIETSEQLGDMFTKGLAWPTFEYLRSKNHWLVIMHYLLFLFLYLSSVIEYKLERECRYRFSASCCSQGFLLHFE